MHSRIYKLQPDFSLDYERINEYDFEDDFLSEGRDYVNDEGPETDEENYRWLAEASDWCDVLLETDPFMEHDPSASNIYTLRVRKADAVKELNRRKELIEASMKATTREHPETFFDYKTKLLFCGDNYGFWFAIDGWGNYNEVELLLWCIRECKDDEDSVLFRLEGSLDYHS